MKYASAALFVLIAGTAAIAQPTTYSTGFEAGEGFNASPTRTIGSITFPQPLGPGGTAVDRVINNGVHNQAGWNVTFDNARMDQEINVAGDNSRIGLNPSGVRTGNQSWRFSNWWHTGVVNSVLSPAVAAAGESGSGNNGTVARSGSNNQMTVSFDFRSVANAFDVTQRYSDMSFSATDAPGRRLAFMGLGEWDGTGRLVAYSSAVTGSAAGNNTAFGATTLTDLAWGTWYNVSMSFLAVDGPANDVVTYTITNLATNTVIASYSQNSWEEFYRQGLFGNPVGTVPGVNHIGFRNDFNADYSWGGGTDPLPGLDNPQAPFDSYSTLNLPTGFYIDNFSITVVPTPGAAALLGLAGLAATRRRR